MITWVIVITLLPPMTLAQVNLPCNVNSSNGYPEGLVLGCQKNCITSTAKEKAVEMKCDEGFVLLDSVCIQKEELLCPNGSKLVGEACIREITHEPECPIGSEILNGICVRIYDRVCPFSYEMSNGQCIRDVIEPVTCPPGTTRKYNECIRITCPKEYNLVNGVCVTEEKIHETTTCLYTCPEGYVYEDLACKPIETTPTDVPRVVTPTVLCPAVQQPGGIHPFTSESPLLQPRPPCGPGFEMRDNDCIRISTYCPNGFVPRGDKCEKIACPGSLIWNGQYCVSDSYNSPGSNVNHTQLINNYNNITHGTHVNVQNINNVIVYKGGSVERSSNGTEQTTIVESTERTEVINEPKPDQCCTIITPRICKHFDSKWRCYNRKYQRCGRFCTQPRIQLKPIQPIYRHQILVMPPIPPVAPNCGEDNCSIGSINCSGCQIGGFCSPSCYQYSCEIINCEYHDHQSFCEEYAGPGCGPLDGPYIE